MTNKSDKNSKNINESKRVPTQDHSDRPRGTPTLENHKIERGGFTVKNTMPAPINPNGGGKDKK